IVFQSMHVISFNFQARVQGKYLSLSLIIQMLIGNLLKIYCILIKAPLVVFVWVYFIEGVILALTLTMTYLKQGGTLRSWKYRATRAKTLLKDSWLLVFSGVLVAIYMKIDIVMLREMAGDQAAGIYAASAKISEAWYFIPVAICASLFPAILAARASSSQKYNSQMQHLFTLLAWVAIAIATVITFTGQWLVDLTFGKAYSDAGLVLVVHIWSGIFVFLGVASSKWLIAENLQQKIFNRSLVGAVSNILLNWLLIEPYGALGAAIATLVSYIIFAYVYDLIDREMRSVFVMKSKALFLPLNRAH
ncbi:MAG: flippase, partial [Arenicella sp.]|nr:flippase [Arenicella sp.]